MPAPIPNDAAIRPLLTAVLAKVGPVELTHQDLGDALLDVATGRAALTFEGIAGGTRLSVTTT